MKKAFITKDFIDGLSLPNKGEVWISDTRIRGFGIRLWASTSSNGMAFCIRTTNKNGKSVRKTYSCWSRGNPYLLRSLRFFNDEYNNDLELPFTAFLEDARKWAIEEIARLKGHAPTFEELDATAQEHNQTLKHFKQYLSKRTLGSLVEQILDKGKCRGWSQEYCDRLRRAFNAFDPHDEIRKLKIETLEDGRLKDLIADTTVSAANLKLLRSLLKRVFKNLFEMGGVRISSRLPEQFRLTQAMKSSKVKFLKSLSTEGFENLLSHIHKSNANWRSKSCIELCLYFGVPKVQVMSGTWSRIYGDRWVPYLPEQRESWEWYLRLINQPIFECLKKIRKNAQQEGIYSNFWFPNPKDPSKHIANIDRAWFSILKQAGWPSIPLSESGKAASVGLRYSQTDDIYESDKINAEIAKWDFTCPAKL